MRVLVVQPAWLGDTVFLGPAVRALKARWPDGAVALCVTPRGAPVARLLPGCDEVVVYDKRGRDRGPAGLARAALRLRAFRPDLALVPHPSPRSGLLAWASGAPRRLGYAPLCTERLPRDPRAPFVERSLALCARAGAGGPPDLRLAPPPALDAYADRALAGAGRPLVGLVPGAEWATKRWGAGRYAALAALLAGDGASCVLLGGPAELGLAEEVRARAGVRLWDTTGNAVDEALAVLARCDLVVGGDTGLVHCARALGRPAVVVFGPTDPAHHRFADGERAVAVELPCRPCHEHGPRRCPLRHHRCMEGLEVGVVAGAARALLRAREPWPA